MVDTVIYSRKKSRVKVTFRLRDLIEHFGFSRNSMGIFAKIGRVICGEKIDNGGMGEMSIRLMNIEGGHELSINPGVLIGLD
jgi:hypothetical protein